MIGQTLAHYKILEKIGSGGMGDVYLAADTKLDRKVALKVLPPELAESEERRARFTREAKALAALDHPNIVTVHSVEEADGIHFITMQLVQGKTLTELLPKNGFPLNKFFEIAIPLADAVAAAHQEGITHRDLKPDNMMVGEDGRIKVLDFGLAKPTSGFAGVGSESDAPTAAKTAAGVILGTVNYMSPEQAQGKTVDARSDIFSLGVVFYEMLTGVRPFRGETPAEVLSSIIKDEPRALTDFDQEVPRELAKTIRRCLTKDSERRYQSAKDIRNELDELKTDLSSGELRESAQTKSAAVNKWLAAATVTLLLVVIAGAIYFTRTPRIESFRLVNPVQVTSALGVEDYPAWSPDGTTLAYAASMDTNLFLGNWDIWVSQVPGEQPLNRTADHDGNDRYPSWSPDGQRIAFWSDRSAGGYYVMPAFAGAPRKIVNDEGIEPSRLEWSPDGSEVAYVVRDGTRVFVETASLSAGESRRVLLPEAITAFDLAWSPSGNLFAYIGSARARDNQVTRLWILRVADGVAMPITDGVTNVWSPSWSPDGRTLYFVSDRGGTMDLWSQHMKADGSIDMPPERLTTGVEMRYATFSSDGTRLVYSKGKRISNVWRVPILEERPATWSDAQQITFDQAFVEFVSISPNGQRLIVSSDRAGNPDLWMLPSEGGDMQAITDDPTPDWFSAWSPDGKEIAFYAYRSGNRDIWVMPADGGAARQLTNHPARDSYPAWSPDGKEIVFDSYRGGSEDLWIMPAEGGEPRQLTKDSGSNPVWSPDGQWIAFTAYPRSTDAAFWRIRPTGEDLEPLTAQSTANAQFSHFSPDGGLLLFEREQDLWILSLESRLERRITDLSGRPGSPLGYGSASDGHYLYFCWSNDLYDLWVMDVVTDESE